MVSYRLVEAKDARKLSAVSGPILQYLSNARSKTWFTMLLKIQPFQLKNPFTTRFVETYRYLITFEDGIKIHPNT